MKTLSVIGAGRVGLTLGRLFNEKKIFDIVRVFNRSLDKAKASVDFIGKGLPVYEFSDLVASDVYMITSSDDSIAKVSAELIKTNILKQGSIVFHCSGVMPSTILHDLKSLGCLIASVHPIKSFADPKIAVTDFDGTFCGIEGDEEAVTLLKSAFTSIGGRLIEINPDKKAIYHAATAQACNNLIALMESAILMYMEAGLTRQQSLEVMEPIVRGTVKNVFLFDTTKALTGPIARGDVKTVEMHLDALSADSLALSVYTSLGFYLLDLSSKMGQANPESLMGIENKLREKFNN